MNERPAPPSNFEPPAATPGSINAWRWDLGRVDGSQPLYEKGGGPSGPLPITADIPFNHDFRCPIEPVMIETYFDTFVSRGVLDERVQSGKFVDFKTGCGAGRLPEVLVSPRFPADVDALPSRSRNWPDSRPSHTPCEEPFLLDMGAASTVQIEAQQALTSADFVRNITGPLPKSLRQNEQSPDGNSVDVAPPYPVPGGGFLLRHDTGDAIPSRFHPSRQQKRRLPFGMNGDASDAILSPSGSVKASAESPEANIGSPFFHWPTVDPLEGVESSQGRPDDLSPKDGSGHLPRLAQGATAFQGLRSQFGRPGNAGSVRIPSASSNPNLGLAEAEVCVAMRRAMRYNLMRATMPIPSATSTPEISARKAAMELVLSPTVRPGTCESGAGPISRTRAAATSAFSTAQPGNNSAGSVWIPPVLTRFARSDVDVQSETAPVAAGFQMDSPFHCEDTWMDGLRIQGKGDLVEVGNPSQNRHVTTDLLATAAIGAPCGDAPLDNHSVVAETSIRADSFSVTLSSSTLSLTTVAKELPEHVKTNDIWSSSGFSFLEDLPVFDLDDHLPVGPRFSSQTNTYPLTANVPLAATPQTFSNDVPVEYRSEATRSTSLRRGMRASKGYPYVDEVPPWVNSLMGSNTTNSAVGASTATRFDVNSDPVQPVTVPTGVSAKTASSKQSNGTSGDILFDAESIIAQRTSSPAKNRDRATSSGKQHNPKALSDTSNPSDSAGDRDQTTFSEKQHKSEQLCDTFNPSDPSQATSRRKSKSLSDTSNSSDSSVEPNPSVARASSPVSSSSGDSEDGSGSSGTSSS